MFSNRWSNEFNRLQRDMDRLHNAFFGENMIADMPAIERPQRGEVSVYGPHNRIRAFNGVEKYVPHVDVKDAEKEILVHVDLPGLEKKDVNITVSPGLLRIHGERSKQKKEEKDGGNFTREERFHGCYETQVRLPDTIDGQTPVDAKLENGVLEVVIKKPVEAKTTRQITVA